MLLRALHFRRGVEVVLTVRGDAAGEREAMDLADDRVAGDAAQDAGDLARGFALFPEGGASVGALLIPLDRAVGLPAILLVLL